MMAAVRWCVLMAVTLTWLTIAPLDAGPVSINPAISPFGRNIRPIACKSKTGQLGTCMFAMDCTRMNGVHLGTCIDRFYFGSCCAASDTLMDIAFPPTSSVGFTGENHLGTTSSSVPLGPISTIHHVTSTENLNVLNDVTTTTTPFKTSSETTALPSLGTDSPSSPLPIADTVTTTTTSTTTPATTTTIETTTTTVEPTTTETTTTTTTTTTTVAPTTETTPEPTSTTTEPTTTTTTTTVATTTEAELTTTASTTTTTTALPSTSPSPAPPAETTTSSAQVTSELTTVGTASSALPEKTTATESSTDEDRIEIDTTVEPFTDLPSVSIEPFVSETELPDSTEEPQWFTGSHLETVPLTEVPEESTEAIKEEVPTTPSTTTTSSEPPTTTTTTTTAASTEAVTSPVTSPAASPSSSAVPETTTAAAPIQAETSPASIASLPVTAEPSTSLPEPSTSTPEPSTFASSTSPSPLIELSSTSEPPTSPSETSVAATDLPVVEITEDPILITGEPDLSEPITTPSVSSTTLGELNDTTVEGATVQFQNYREVCGRPKYQYPSARIVGGTTTQYGQWPWQVSLRQWRTATFLHKCGAALLNENWAITAAHCVDNVQPDDLLLRMGEYDLATDEEEYPYIERKVQIVASHPQFDSRTFEYDLALLRFYDPVRFQPNIVPICLPPPGEVDFVGRTAFVTGWGRLYEDGPLPSKMQQVSVPVINNTDCENMYRRAGYVEHIPNIFICAGYADGKRDSCEGDSGGPMVIQEEQSWVLAGVISWGIGCAEANQPGVYTRISEFREWIDKIIVF